MKKWIALAAGTLSLSLLLTGCGPKQEETQSGSQSDTQSQTGSQSQPEPQPPAQEQAVMYSNLTDKTSREKLIQLLNTAGISSERQMVFFGHLDQFNGVIPPEMLTTGMEEYDPAISRYDPYEMQAKWEAAYPDYLGQNCRITAYTLFGDLVTVTDKTVIRDDFIRLDQDALDYDPWESKNGEKGWWMSDFELFYSGVPTEATQEVRTHLENLQKDWQDRGILFTDNDKVHLISVVLHDNLDGDQLFVGHAALLFPEGDHLWLLEKLAFQEPYQLVRFEDREQLNEYLMTKYDLDQGQPLAAPFIMENDKLMEGYQRLRAD